MASTEFTSLSGAEFRTTAWSVIREAQNPRSPDYARSLERLMRIYWKPIYWTIRFGWKEDPENARDLTQQYLAMFLEKGLFGQASESRGRFRGFVKTTLKHFLLSVRRDGAAKKRGGGSDVVSLDAVDLDRLEAHGARQDLSPEKSFDRELLRSLMEDALADLDREMKSQGRAADLALFVKYYASSATYESLASEAGISVTDVTNRLYQVRRQYRQRVLDRLRDGVSSEEELLSDARELLDEG